MTKDGYELHVIDGDVMIHLGLCFLSIHEEVSYDELLMCAKEQGVI